MTGVIRRSESSVALGARWITAAFVAVGLLNYGYALVLTRLLSVGSYAQYSAGQSLILWASAIATAAIPWMLAQSLARAESDGEREMAIRAALLSCVVGGCACAAVAGLIASTFAGPGTAAILSISTLIIFLGTMTTGVLQGREQMRKLSALYVGENVTKNASGLLLVALAGLREAGALAAFGIGGLIMLLRWPRRAAPASAGAARMPRSLGRRMARLAAAQGLVSLLGAADVVLVAVLPVRHALAASYQVSVTMSRVPLFIAGAVATAFFPALVRSSDAPVLAARAGRMYAAAALPLAAILATAPHAVLALAFPAQFSSVAGLLRYTAVAGAAAGGVALATVIFLATDDRGLLQWLAIGLTGYLIALVAGWRVAGIGGLAAGAAISSAALLAWLMRALVRRLGAGLLSRMPVAEPAVAAVVLVLLRPHPLVWLAAAVLAGWRSARRFWRPGARHRRSSPWRSASGDRRTRAGKHFLALSGSSPRR